MPLLEYYWEFYTASWDRVVFFLSMCVMPIPIIWLIFDYLKDKK